MGQQMISQGLKEKMKAEGWLTITEAVHTYSLSHSTLYRLIQANQLPSKRVGGVRTNTQTGRGNGTLFVEQAALVRIAGI